MSPYFDYYSTRCRGFSQDGGHLICVKSHQDLVDITEQILLGDATRSDIQRLLRSRLETPVEEKRIAAIHTTIDLCGSLLLMAEFGVHELSYSGCHPLPWSGPQTLRQAVEQHFQHEKELQPDNPRLGVLFTARNLQYIGGKKIEWTTNIVDHLLLSDDDQTVSIFHHVGFLCFQQRYELSPLPLSWMTITQQQLLVGNTLTAQRSASVSLSSQTPSSTRPSALSPSSFPRTTANPAAGSAPRSPSTTSTRTSPGAATSGRRAGDSSTFPSGTTGSSSSSRRLTSPVRGG